jgi:hypothetical protein
MILAVSKLNGTYSLLGIGPEKFIANMERWPRPTWI